MSVRTKVVLSSSGFVELSRAVDKELVQPMAEAVAADMRRLVPVLTGDLQSSIEVEHLAGSSRVNFGDTSRGIDYHLYQEFGTSRMAAQPYARPALYKRRAL